MVEGYPEMDDYEEAELVASGEINVEDCEDAETVSRILHKQGFDDLALDYNDYHPKKPGYYNNNYNFNNHQNKYKTTHKSKRTSKNKLSDIEDLLIGLGLCIIPIVILVAIIYFVFFW